jgi:hypothetical protein
MSANPSRLTISFAAVDHEAIRSLLSTYAAGGLDTRQSAVVREHLASGCAECLHALYSYPMGLPRRMPLEPEPLAPAHVEIAPAGPAIAPVTVTASSSAPASAASEVPVPVPRRRRRIARMLGVVLVALLVSGAAALAAWTIAELRARESRARAEAARATSTLRETEGARAEVAARLVAVEAERDAARRDAARQLDASREAAETNEQLNQELAILQARIDTLLRDLQRREQEIDRLLIGADERNDLRELLATPGVEILHLQPRQPFRDVIGHVLFHPTRTAIVLYAFDLPSAPVGSHYRIRLGLDDAQMENGPTFRPGPRGDVALPLRLRVDAAHLRAVEVVLDPPGEAVLGGSRSLGNPSG